MQLVTEYEVQGYYPAQPVGTWKTWIGGCASEEIAIINMECALATLFPPGFHMRVVKVERNVVAYSKE